MNRPLDDRVRLLSQYAARECFGDFGLVVIQLIGRRRADRPSHFRARNRDPDFAGRLDGCLGKGCSRNA